LLSPVKVHSFFQPGIDGRGERTLSNAMGGETTYVGLVTTFVKKKDVPKENI